MLTSLAPSPMAKVIFSGNLSFMRQTISAFYAGLTLHANTTFALSAAFKNNSLRS